MIHATRILFLCSLLAATADGAELSLWSSNSISSIYRTDYNDGYDAGYTVGYGDGYLVGEARGLTEGAVDGKQDGYDHGYAETYQSSYDAAYADNYAVSFEEAYAPAYDAAYPLGRDDGYAYVVDLATTQQLVAVDANGVVSVAAWRPSNAAITLWRDAPRDSHYGGSASGDVTIYSIMPEEYDPERAAHYFDLGFNHGKGEGYTDGDALGYEEGYGVAYEEAYAPALEIGREEGITEGFLNGTEEGTQTGLDEGGLFGEADGYAAGLDAGIEIAWAELDWTVTGSIPIDGVKFYATQYYAFARAAVPEPGGATLAAAAGLIGLVRRR